LCCLSALPSAEYLTVLIGFLMTSQLREAISCFFFFFIFPSAIFDVIFCVLHYCFVIFLFFSFFFKKSSGSGTGPLSLVSTSEELLDRKVVAPVYKTENTAVGIRHADHLAPSIGTLCPQKLTITSLTGGGRSVGIVRSRTQNMEFPPPFFFGC
jgi:hypothetical protein